MMKNGRIAVVNVVDEEYVPARLNSLLLFFVVLLPVPVGPERYCAECSRIPLVGGNSSLSCGRYDAEAKVFERHIRRILLCAKAEYCGGRRLLDEGLEWRASNAWGQRD